MNRKKIFLIMPTGYFLSLFLVSITLIADALRVNVEPKYLLLMNLLLWSIGMEIVIWYINKRS